MHSRNTPSVSQRKGFLLNPDPLGRELRLGGFFVIMRVMEQYGRESLVSRVRRLRCWNRSAQLAKVEQQFHVFLEEHQGVTRLWKEYRDLNETGLIKLTIKEMELEERKEVFAIMSLNKTHDATASIFAAIAFVFVGFFVRLPWDVTFLLTLSILIGGYYLSPDLDTKHSLPSRRWGALCLKWWWAPYQCIFSHRSFYTHCPVLGTAIRVLWLSPFWLAFFSFVLPPDKTYVITILVGLEIASFSHLLTDV